MSIKSNVMITSEKYIGNKKYMR